MQITLKIFRYNPEVDKKFHYETYTFEAPKRSAFWICSST